jgi:hypothetical protein
MVHGIRSFRAGFYDPVDSSAQCFRPGLYSIIFYLYLLITMPSSPEDIIPSGPSHQPFIAWKERGYNQDFLATVPTEPPLISESGNVFIYDEEVSSMKR